MFSGSQVLRFSAVNYLPLCIKNKITCQVFFIKVLLPSHNFVFITDSVIREHLEGKHTMGIYPLLTDETCWFLAIDFDKESWTDDVTAFMETGRNLKIPTALERSRSGKGAHVWIFFSAPIAKQIRFSKMKPVNTGNSPLNFSKNSCFWLYIGF